MRDVPHILVADNDYAIRRMLEIGLSLNGFDVTSVRSAYEALRVAKAGEFHAVLTDSFMSGASGMDILDELRVTRPKIPIVLMTARGSVETAFEAMSRGAADFIGKPFDLAMVVQTCGAVLTQGARRRFWNRRYSRLTFDPPLVWLGEARPWRWCISLLPKPPGRMPRF